VIRPVPKQEDGWLLFDAPLPNGGPLLRDVEVVSATLLGLNAALPAGCKYALVGVSDLRVRAEQPASAEFDAPAWMAALEAGFAAASHQLSAGAAAKPCSLEASKDDAFAPELASLCREAGWAFEERSNGALVVDLGVRGTYVPALVEARGSGIAVEATIVVMLPAARGRRVALGSLLWRTKGAFRLARAFSRSA
jgi:hypothetical protein